MLLDQSLPVLDVAAHHQRLGVLLAGAPMLALDMWIDGVILRQGANDTETFARRSVNLAESRLTIYWEGAVRVVESERVVGRGYLELTGYAGAIRL